MDINTRSTGILIAKAGKEMLLEKGDIITTNLKGKRYLTLRVLGVVQTIHGRMPEGRQVVTLTLETESYYSILIPL